MLASLEDARHDDPQFVYEPKYDGIRAIAEVGPDAAVRLWSRLGNEKTQQFPEIATALSRWARRLKAPVILDGEVVALDSRGEPAGFQKLQGRIHLNDPSMPAPRRSRPSRPSRPSSPSSPSSPSNVAFIAFDILREGNTDYRDRPLLERRAELERVFGKTGSPLLRISTIVRSDGRALYKEALERGWEGLIAKHAASLYKSGKRTPDWRKIKIVHEQEFVIGGWTEPRQARTYFGALLLGVYANQRRPVLDMRERHRASASARGGGAPRELIYIGHTGTGFNERELARVMKLLKPLETKESPFLDRPKTNERPHWVRPELVAQVKFTEWTADGKLRHPVYLGLRDDKKPEDVMREEKPRVRGARTSSATAKRDPGGDNVVEQLDAIERSRADGVLTLPGGETLKVTNLHKVFWPKQKLTKGDLLRYYVRVAPFILPAVADRPLVLKRYPNGIAGKWFYQHRVDIPPKGVRTEVVSVEETRAQIVGGNLATLLYTTQLAAISQDPWFSRVQHPEFVDYVALDLDPSEGVPFARVLDVARWIHDELDALGAVGVPKTSGASGLHVYMPLPAGTPYDAGLLFCQIVATVVAQKHPKVATIERSVRARGARVYVDCLQNILGKTLATAYSARASDYAGVSTPLTWGEIDEGVDRSDFTIQSVPARLEKAGDLWAALRKSKGVNLARVARYAERVGKGRAKRDRS
jgi:bifunctional non-homologous end joining protein LigD